jgi:hypothetical protein
MTELPVSIASKLKNNDEAILLGIAEGVPFSDIGATIGYTSNQVSNRVVWLRKIFKANTTPQLIALSYHYGILRTPNDTPKAQQTQQTQ